MPRAIAPLATLAIMTAALATACSSSPPTAQTAAETSSVVINVGDQQQELETLLNVSGVLTQVAKLILAAGGTETYVPITAGVQSALQQMVNLMASSGGLPAAFSVAPLFSQSEATRYNAIVAGVPQNG